MAIMSILPMGIREAPAVRLGTDRMVNIFILHTAIPMALEVRPITGLRMVICIRHTVTLRAWAVLLGIESHNSLSITLHLKDTIVSRRS
jgi:hypothetical protein